MLDAATDLFLGSACVGCGRPGRMLCPACAALLPTEPRVAWPSPVPPGLVTPWACAEYDGAVRAMVVGHKDRHQWGFRRRLGALLAVAVDGAVRGVPDGDPLVLVPVPSRPGSARRRGYDPAAAVVRSAAAGLRAGGRPVDVAALLVSSRGVLDQAGLGATDRAANLAGSMSCPSDRLGRVARRRQRAHVVVCDDVLTTGASAREAQRALAAVGVPPLAVAVVAATQRRLPGPREAIHSEHSAPPLAPTVGSG